MSAFMTKSSINSILSILKNIQSGYSDLWYNMANVNIGILIIQTLVINLEYYIQK